MRLLSTGSRYLKSLYRSDVSGFLTKAQIRTDNKLSESERHSKDTKPLGKEPKDPEKDKNVAKPETKSSSNRNVAPKEGKKRLRLCQDLVNQQRRW